MPITRIVELEFQGNHTSITLNFAGGVKAWKLGQDRWCVGPLLIDNKPVIVGDITKSELRSTVDEMGLAPIIVENLTYLNGSVFRTWQAVRFAGDGQEQPATSSWRNISSNLSSRRLDRFVQDNPSANAEEIIKQRDNNPAIERYADYVSDSLCSMDICMGEACNFYYDQLSSSLHNGRHTGQKYETAAELTFVANVHSFFMHLGAARDYLAAFIAVRCDFPERIDDMSRLLTFLRWNSLPEDPILQRLINHGYVVQKEQSTRLEQAGWLREITNVRNELIHRRPYGSSRFERLGEVKKVGKSGAGFRFYKPILIGGTNVGDVLDFMSDIYRATMLLFNELAKISGQDTSIQMISDNDIKNLRIISEDSRDD